VISTPHGRAARKQSQRSQFSRASLHGKINSQTPYAKMLNKYGRRSGRITQHNNVSQTRRPLWATFNSAQVSHSDNRRGITRPVPKKRTIHRFFKIVKHMFLYKSK